MKNDLGKTGTICYNVQKTKNDERNGENVLVKRSYICHRDGKYDSKSNGIVALKGSGSNKIDGRCTSQIVCTNAFIIYR